MNLVKFVYMDLNNFVVPFPDFKNEMARSNIHIIKEEDTQELCGVTPGSE